MHNLTSVGQNIMQEIASRYSLSFDSAVSMLLAVQRGGGSMAQFSCPELGSGQWMRGGMTMVGDMFNHGLKATVDNLCHELSAALAQNSMFESSSPGGPGGGQWWPEGLGSPSSCGAQNDVRYAFFPQAHRLVVDREGQVSVFNSLDHRIGGVSQQQGAGSSLTFTSQYGIVSTLSLPLISGPGLQGHPTNFAAPSAPAASMAVVLGGASAHEITALLEKLGQLRDAGVLTAEEFTGKKAELLARL